MNIEIITISQNDNLHTPWTISMDERIYNLQKENNVHYVPKYFIESEDKKVLQKIKVGYPFDTTFDPEKASIGELYKGEGVSQQLIQVPYTHIYTNPKTMNFFLSDPVIDGNDEIVNANDIDHGNQDGIVILILDKEYQYIRSSINEELGEIISTFHTENSIGCILLLNNKGIKKIPERQNPIEVKKKWPHEYNPENVLAVDTKYGDSFVHIRFNISMDSTLDTYLYPMIGETSFNTIKNVLVIERLKKLLEETKINKRKPRKFTRTSKKLITNYFVVSNSYTDDMFTEDEEQTKFGMFIEKHDFSSVVNPANEVVVLNINTDENGYVITDDAFNEVLSYMKQEKIKAFTLVGCKIQGVIFNELRPSYIFITDETESVIEDKIKTIKCFKSN